MAGCYFAAVRDDDIQLFIRQLHIYFDIDAWAIIAERGVEGSAK